MLGDYGTGGRQAIAGNPAVGPTSASCTIARPTEIQAVRATTLTNRKYLFVMSLHAPIRRQTPDT